MFCDLYAELACFDFSFEIVIISHSNPLAFSCLCSCEKLAKNRMPT